jgi:hypothetical protein
VYNQIDTIRRELHHDIFVIENDPKLVSKFFGKHGKIFTEEEVLVICKYITNQIGTNIDNKLNDYLYDEAKILKEVIERMDGMHCDFDD